MGQKKKGTGKNFLNSLESFKQKIDKEKITNNMVKSLQKLGYNVDLTKKEGIDAA